MKQDKDCRKAEQDVKKSKDNDRAIITKIQEKTASPAPQKSKISKYTPKSMILDEFVGILPTIL